MTTDDSHKFFGEVLTWASRTGRGRELREVVDRLEGEFSGDPVALGQLRRLLGQIQAAAATEVPAEWVMTATARIAELEAAAVGPRPGVLDRARELLQQVARVFEATLVGDTFAGQALQGIRGSTAHQPRHLHFVSELGDVHLQVDPSGRASAVLGQFVPSRAELLDTPIRAQATSSDGTQVVELDPGAQFNFADVPDGEVRIELSTGTESLRLAPFWIRPRHEE